jgi:hypothetical protein
VLEFAEGRASPDCRACLGWRQLGGSHHQRIQSTVSLGHHAGGGAFTGKTPRCMWSQRHPGVAGDEVFVLADKDKIRHVLGPFTTLTSRCAA